LRLSVLYGVDEIAVARGSFGEEEGVENILVVGAFGIDRPSSGSGNEPRRCETHDREDAPNPGQREPRTLEEARAPIPYKHPPDVANVKYGPHERNAFDLWNSFNSTTSPKAGLDCARACQKAQQHRQAYSQFHT
jgi:hypothetical protein